MYSGLASFWLTEWILSLSLLIGGGGGLGVMDQMVLPFLFSYRIISGLCYVIRIISTVFSNSMKALTGSLLQQVAIKVS